MTKNIEDGGPAFPVHPEAHNRSDAEYSVLSGMTLRDWFAGQVVSGLVADPNVTFHSQDAARKIAVASYMLADAMLKARNQ